MKNNCNIGIKGTGSYIPEKVMTNLDLEKIVDTSDEWITARTGIKERRIAEGENTSDLAAKAGTRAIESAGLKPEDIDMVIVATMSPDQPTPATACSVQEKMGLRKVPAFDISAACSGFVFGLSAAYSFVASGICENVLLIGAEKMSSILDWTDRGTCVIFGDGAGAAVIGKTDSRGIMSFVMGSDGSGAGKLIVPAGGSVMPFDDEALGNGGQYMKMNGSDIFKFAVRKLPELADEALKKAGMTSEELDFMIPHQANIRIIDAANKKLKLDKEKILINLDRYGNMSAASIPAALDEGVKSGKIKKGDRLLLIGFGGGLTWGACVMESGI